MTTRHAQLDPWEIDQMDAASLRRLADEMGVVDVVTITTRSPKLRDAALIARAGVGFHEDCDNCRMATASYRVASGDDRGHAPCTQHGWSEVRFSGAT